MLICSVFTDKEGKFSKLIIQPEITDGDEKIEISLTSEQADQIKALEIISEERE